MERSQPDFIFSGSDNTGGMYSNNTNFNSNHSGSGWYRRERRPFYTDKHYYRDEDEDWEDSNWETLTRQASNLPRNAPTLWMRTWEHSALAAQLINRLVPMQGRANTREGKVLRVMYFMYRDYNHNGNITLDDMMENGALPRGYTPPSDTPKSFQALFRRSRLGPIKASEIEQAMQDVVLYAGRDPATRIQTAFRGHAARKKFAAKRTAATKIQTAFRGHAARKQYADMLNRHYAPGGAGAQQAFEHFTQVAGAANAAARPHVVVGPRKGMYVQHPDGRKTRIDKMKMARGVVTGALAATLRGRSPTGLAGSALPPRRRRL
jgi:hypothetical protein